MKKLITALMLLFPALSFAVDVDSDGYDDIVVAQKSGSAWRFFAYTSSSGFTNKMALGNYANTDSDPILGQWASAGFTPGTIQLKSNGEYAFSAIDGASQVLGSEKHGVLLGVDLNFNGVSDITLVKPNGTIEVTQDFFTSSASVSRFMIAKRAAKRGIGIILNGPVAGTVRLVGRLERKRIKFITESGANKLGSVKARNLSGAFAIASTGTAENAILFAVKNDRGTLLLVKNTSGKTLGRKVIKEKVQVISVGNYTSGTGEEVIIKTKKSTKTFNLFDGTVSSISISGKLLTEKEYIKKRSTTTSEGTTTPAGGSLSAVCPGGIRGVSSGVLWKPDSDVSDNRGGKPVILFWGGNKPRGSSIKIYASNGEHIGTFTFKAPNEPGINGGADHYYSGWVGGSGETGGQLASKARAVSGSDRVYFTGPGGSCFGSVHPDQRTGSQ